MGVTKLPSTLDGGLTPICNKCGATESWDIAEEEYKGMEAYWDNRHCDDCCHLEEERMWRKEHGICR